jgi:hypothetical protein
MLITSATARTTAALLALIAWTGLILQVAGVFPRSASLIDALWTMLRFFTITTNLILAVVMTGIALGRPAFGSPRLLGGVTIALAFVGGVNAALLSGGLPLNRSDLIADLFLHYVTPVAMLVFWLTLRPHGALRRRDPVLWSLYPLAYAAYALARGAADGNYTYPFINVTQIGVGRTAANITLLWLTFLLLGALLVWLDRRGSPLARQT